jgi:hypothetical protein
MFQFLPWGSLSDPSLKELAKAFPYHGVLDPRWRSLAPPCTRLEAFLLTLLLVAMVVCEILQIPLVIDVRNARRRLQRSQGPACHQWWQRVVWAQTQATQRIL